MEFLILHFNRLWEHKYYIADFFKFVFIKVSVCFIEFICFMVNLLPFIEDTTIGVIPTRVFFFWTIVFINVNKIIFMIFYINHNIVRIHDKKLKTLKCIKLCILKKKILFKSIDKSMLAYWKKVLIFGKTNRDVFLNISMEYINTG